MNFFFLCALVTPKHSISEITLRVTQQASVCLCETYRFDEINSSSSACVMTKCDGLELEMWTSRNNSDSENTALEVFSVHVDPTCKRTYFVNRESIDCLPDIYSCNERTKD